MSANIKPARRYCLPIDEVGSGEQLCKQLAGILDCVMIAANNDELSPDSVHDALAHCFSIIGDLKNIIGTRQIEKMVVV